MDELSQAWAVVREIEAEYPDANAYEIANLMRRHTRPSYTERLFDLATLSAQEHLDRRLDLVVMLAGQTTDFAHLVASLSDQLQLPDWAKWFDATTRWTGKHSSWAGDLGQAVLDYRDGKFQDLDTALAADASFPDLAADVAAVRIGRELNRHPQWKVSEAIALFQQLPYAESVRTFVVEELNGELRGKVLWNYNEAIAFVGRSVAEFLTFAALQRVAKRRRLDAGILTFSEAQHPDVEQAAAYFIRYLCDRGNLV
jgi:hypothetical protein